MLPLELRHQALTLKGEKNYGKLWPAITATNKAYGLPARGHLDELVVKQRRYLTQFTSRFEYQAGQSGALFFLGDRLAGIEVAPTAAYFEEVWTALVCFCYGPAAMRMEKGVLKPPPLPFEADSLAALRKALAISRDALRSAVHETLTTTPAERFEMQEEERYLDLRLCTATGDNLAGQVVTHNGELVYASMTASAEYALG